MNILVLSLLLVAATSAYNFTFVSPSENTAGTCTFPSSLTPPLPGAWESGDEGDNEYMWFRSEEMIFTMNFPVTGNLTAVWKAVSCPDREQKTFDNCTITPLNWTLTWEDPVSFRQSISVSGNNEVNLHSLDDFASLTTLEDNPYVFFDKPTKRLENEYTRAVLEFTFIEDGTLISTAGCLWVAVILSKKKIGLVQSIIGLCCGVGGGK